MRTSRALPFSVSSTITTASAPSGKGAPVATWMQVPRATRSRATWPVKTVSMQSSVFGSNELAPKVSAAITA